MGRKEEKKKEDISRLAEGERVGLGAPVGENLLASRTT